MATTKHTCGGPVFGQRTPGCPRCDELAAGAVPVRWRNTTRTDDLARSRAIREHRCDTSKCGLTCTFGEW